jgi:hypothetical protein
MSSPSAESTVKYDELVEKVSALQSAILSKHPTLPSLLQEIHRTLRTYPECVTLLPEDKIQIIVSGLEAQTSTYLVTSTIKSTKSTAAAKSVQAKIAKLGLDAI